MAVNVHTTMVSIKGSMPATTASRTGSLVLAAEWAMGDDPCPASLENRARFIPYRKAYPAVPPMKAPVISWGMKADLRINRNMAGISPALAINTTVPPNR